MDTVTKDPGAVLPYGWDWANFGANDAAATDTGWLQADTISTSTWAITGTDALLIADSDSNTATATSVTLSAGTANYDYHVTNHITTAAGYEDERTLLVKVRNR